MQAIISFLTAHLTALCVLAVAIIDFLIAVNPNLKSNSIIQVLLSVFTKGAGSAAPQA